MYGATSLYRGIDALVSRGPAAVVHKLYARRVIYSYIYYGTRRSKQQRRRRREKVRKKIRKKSPNKWPVLCKQTKKKTTSSSVPHTQNNLYIVHDDMYIGPTGRLAPRRPVSDF